MNVSGRKILELYRIFQYKVCGRNRCGVMNPGQRVKIDHFRNEINFGDVVHPCVRYIPQGYLGHCWWMTYTPYYKSQASLENPVLCYSDSDNSNTPPTEWKHYCLVNEKPRGGYNSDPTLLYRDGKLYVFWRENYQDDSHSYKRATYAAKVTETGIERITEPLLVAFEYEEDAETSPCFMPAKDGKVMAYGMHLRFHNPRIKRLRQPFKRIIEKMALLSDLIGIYSQQKHYGLAIWHQTSNDWLLPYTHIKTSRFRNCNKLYRPWHMDFFDWEGKRYCIIQTNMGNADLCLSVSEDDEIFSFYKKPLITNDTIKKLGIYKPCAGVTPEGTFYLYYTAQDPEDRSLNKLYLTKMAFSELLDKIK